MRLTKKEIAYTASGADVIEIPDIEYGRKYTGEAICKLGQLEDIEDKLGIDLNAFLTALGTTLLNALKAQSVFYIDRDTRSRARPGDVVIVETSRFEILLPERRLIAHEAEYDEVGIELSPEDCGKRDKVFGWSFNKDELCPKPQDYNPTVSVEKNLYGDGRDWFRATFEEFPNMIGGIGLTEEEAVKAGYSILRAELGFLIEEGLGFPLPASHAPKPEVN